MRRRNFLKQIACVAGGGALLPEEARSLEGKEAPDLGELVGKYFGLEGRS
jgi:hypothetical protein